MRALRYFMAGLSMPAAVGLLLVVALFAVLVLHQIIWLFVRGRGALPLDVGIEAAFVTVLVAGPLIAFSQVRDTFAYRLAQKDEGAHPGTRRCPGYARS